MDLYNALALLLVVAAVFAYLNHRFLKMPPAIGLMVLGLLASLALVGLAHLGVAPVLALARVVGNIDFSALVMQVMLGFLLFAGSIHVDTRRLGRLRWSVGTLALIGTPLSVALVGGAMYGLLPLLGLPTPLAYCLLFGALISPTDPVAVLSILTKANIDKDLETKIVSESLFNDGVGVVLFVVLLEVAQLGPQDVTVGHALAVFAQEAVGGVALGTVLGLGAAWLLRSVDNYQVEVLLTLALVAGGTALAASLHTSGPLAMVVAGLLVGHFSHHADLLSAQSRDYMNKFWELIDEILNALGAGGVERGKYIGKAGVRKEQVVVLPAQRPLAQPAGVRGQPLTVALVLLQGGAPAPAQPGFIGAVGAQVLGHGPVVVAFQKNGFIRKIQAELAAQLHYLGRVITAVHEVAELNQYFLGGPPVGQQLAEGVQAAVDVSKYKKIHRLF